MRRKDDVASRIFRAGGNASELDKILQDECRRRAAKKLAATLLCFNFRFPTELSAEQCTSDALAEFHASLVTVGSRVVDLTCGLAIDAFHMARRAESVLCIDIDPIVAGCVDGNAKSLGLTNVSSVCADCREWLADAPPFDVAFIDPARRADDGGRLFSLTQCRPDVVSMLDDILAVAPRVLIKASPMLDITQVAAELHCVRSIHATGTRSECKELLIDIERGYDGPVEVWADTIGESVWSVRIDNHADGETPIAAEVKVGDIIGEPWPAVMKCMPRTLGSGLRLHPSTLLWRNPAEDFPGRLYRVERIEEFSSSNLRRLARERIAASVATRNFPLSADALRIRLKATENSAMRLMGATVSTASRPQLLFLSPIL